MTSEQGAEKLFENLVIESTTVIRGMANMHGKIGIEMGMVLPRPMQTALERMQISGELRLIDVAQIETSPEVFFRIFLLTKKVDKNVR